MKTNYKKGGWGGGGVGLERYEKLSTNEIKELQLSELVSRSTRKGSKLPTCAWDSHNYYFIKELLQLAAALAL